MAVSQTMKMRTKHASLTPFAKLKQSHLPAYSAATTSCRGWLNGCGCLFRKIDACCHANSTTVSRLGSWRDASLLQCTNQQQGASPTTLCSLESQGWFMDNDQRVISFYTNLVISESENAEPSAGYKVYREIAAVDKRSIVHVIDCLLLETCPSREG
ncbi:uncharacterized protein BCR38DRAFT_475796, partial [Pseudomassariella vexata]